MIVTIAVFIFGKFNYKHLLTCLLVAGEFISVARYAVFSGFS